MSGVGEVVGALIEEEVGEENELASALSENSRNSGGDRMTDPATSDTSSVTTSAGISRLARRT